MKKHLLIVALSLVMVSFLSMGARFVRLNPQDGDRGIGPVKNLKLGPVDKKMADDGKKIFISKCLLCHDLDQAKVGPPLRNMTKERTPEFLMNYLINTSQMQKEDPEVKAMIEKYYGVVMPAPDITQTQAREVLEYLRSVAQ
jgi:cytochrome c